jgi:sec-independent protein translocase protein TatB
MNISSTEIFVVLIVALIVLGPQRLPGAMKTAGKAYRDFKKMSTTVQNEINQVVNDTTSMVTGPIDTFTGKTSEAAKPAAPSVPSNATFRPADEISDEEIAEDTATPAEPNVSATAQEPAEEAGQADTTTS